MLIIVGKERKSIRMNKKNKLLKYDNKELVLESEEFGTIPDQYNMDVKRVLQQHELLLRDYGQHIQLLEKKIKDGLNENTKKQEIQCSRKKNR